MTTNIDKPRGSSNYQTDSDMLKYMIALHDRDDISNTSLAERIEIAQNKVNKLQYYLRLLDYNKKQLT